MAKSFWSEGIQFQCQGSGKCCVSHGGYGSVFLTLKDRERLAQLKGMKLTQFTAEYCELKDEVWRLKDGATDDCVFLENKRCGVYDARPTQCRTWPFWPEVLNARTWTNEVQTFCPGVGKGRTWTRAEIEEQLRDQRASEADYGT
jgi:Fe-S-cluster containining protein